MEHKITNRLINRFQKCVHSWRHQFWIWRKIPYTECIISAIVNFRCIILITCNIIFMITINISLIPFEFTCHATINSGSNTCFLLFNPGIKIMNQNSLKTILNRVRLARRKNSICQWYLIKQIELLLTSTKIDINWNFYDTSIMKHWESYLYIMMVITRFPPSRE